MSKKRWIMVSAGIIALAMGVFTASVIAAQATDDSKVSDFSARVAQILGLEEQKVEDAMKQAHKELREERMKEKLDALVASGDITQQEADEYMEWIESAPDGIYGFGYGRGKGHGRKGRHGHGFFHK